MCVCVCVCVTMGLLHPSHYKSLISCGLLATAFLGTRKTHPPFLQRAQTNLMPPQLTSSSSCLLNSPHLPPQASSTHLLLFLPMPPHLTSSSHILLPSFSPHPNDFSTHLLFILLPHLFLLLYSPPPPTPASATHLLLIHPQVTTS